MCSCIQIRYLPKQMQSVHLMMKWWSKRLAAHLLSWSRFGSEFVDLGWGLEHSLPSHHNSQRAHKSILLQLRSKFFNLVYWLKRLIFRHTAHRLHSGLESKLQFWQGISYLRGPLCVRKSLAISHLSSPFKLLRSNSLIPSLPKD